jgi:hypothetical protein
MAGIIPRLIHPQTVTIERLDRDSTPWDTVFKEPATDRWSVPSGAVQDHPSSKPQYSAAITLHAQIKYDRAKEVEMSRGGDAPRGDGHLLFHAPTLREAGITLKAGDRCTAIGDFAVEFYFIDIVPMGHYDKPYFIKAVFTRRKQGITDNRAGGLR